MYRRSLAGALTLASMLVGCFVITGSTDGYQGVDAGKVGCFGTADCNPGEVCCGTLTGTPLTPTATCQVAACDGLQLCTTHGECRTDAGIGCATQTCTFDGSSVTLQACGTLRECAYR
jgi:hypothetical protein